MNSSLVKPALKLVLVAAIVVGIVLGGASQSSIVAYTPDNLIRLHVVANSDSAEDQELKLHVRDAVMNAISSHMLEAKNVAAAREILKLKLSEIEFAAQDKVREFGRNYNVSVSLTRSDFPTKSYGSFTLPAGEYEALKVVIGAGNGSNWWCVVFPPLCIVSQPMSSGAARAADGTSKGASRPAFKLALIEALKGLGKRFAASNY